MRTYKQALNQFRKIQRMEDDEALKYARKLKLKIIRGFNYKEYLYNDKHEPHCFYITIKPDKTIFTILIYYIVPKK